MKNQYLSSMITEKMPWLHLGSLQPADIRLYSNTYRSPPGSQVFSPYYFSCIHIPRNTREWLIISKHPKWTLVYLFIALQHKCWRPIGLLVLQSVHMQQMCSVTCLCVSFTFWLKNSYADGWLCLADPFGIYNCQFKEVAHAWPYCKLCA